MRVKMRFVCPEIFAPLANGFYELPDGSTIQECTERCAAERGLALRKDWQDQVLFLKDNRPVRGDDEATDGSDIIVLRRIMGG